MEAILYYINLNKNMLITFLIFISLIGIFSFLFLLKESKMKKRAIFYGLFMQMDFMDILNLSLITLQMFMIQYEMFENSKICVYINFSIIIILTLIYSIFNLKRLLYLLVVTMVQLGVDYFIFIYRSYLIEIENTNIFLNLIEVLMIVCMLFFNILLYFREIAFISKKSKSKKLKSTSLVVKK